MQSASSLLEALERTKNLFRQGEYRIAAGNYAVIVRRAFPTAMDVWIDAMFGLAECQRVLGRWHEATESYALLLRNHHRGASTGRFRQANKLSTVMSTLGFIDMCRLSLSVEHDPLAELIERGSAWASEKIGRAHAAPMFDLASSLLLRNTGGPERAASRMRELLEGEQTPAGSVTLADSMILRYRLAETEADAGLLRVSPPRPPADHFAFGWCNALWRLLEARRMSARGVDRPTLAHWLSRTQFIERDLVQAPDLDLLQRSLHCAAVEGQERSRAFASWADAIDARDPPRRMTNRANPNWHRLWLAGSASTWAERDSGTSTRAAAALDRAQRVFAAPHVAAVLRSRGLTARELHAFQRARFPHLDAELSLRIGRVVRP